MTIASEIQMSKIKKIAHPGRTYNYQKKRARSSLDNSETKIPIITKPMIAKQEIKIPKKEGKLVILLKPSVVKLTKRTLEPPIQQVFLTIYIRFLLIILL